MDALYPVLQGKTTSDLDLLINGTDLGRQMWKLCLTEQLVVVFLAVVVLAVVVVQLLVHH